MGKTYKKNSSGKFDDEFASGRSGKSKKHSIGKKTGGMKTLNSFVEEDYGDDGFNDDVIINDEVIIQHTKQNKT